MRLPSFVAVMGVAGVVSCAAIVQNFSSLSNSAETRTMARIFLTHVPDMLRNYYGERAVAALRELGEVRINDTGRVLDADALAAAARGCEIVVSDRQTPGPAAFFRNAPDLVAFLRCA